MEDLNVLYDYQTFEIQRYGGISRYFYEIIKRTDNKEVALLYSCNEYIKNKDICEYNSTIPLSFFKAFKGLFRKLNRRHAMKMLSAKRYLFHPTYYDTYYLPVLKDSPLILTVHDMIHEKFPQYFSSKDKTAEKKAILISKAQRIIAISNQTKNDLIEFLGVHPDKIDVIYHGINSVKSQYKGLRLPENYILYIGERRRYKNFARLLNAFSTLINKYPDLKLICTGKPFKKDELENLKTLGLINSVKYIAANDNELGQLYREARLFVYPSLYEGFGIPILEAYSNECPVVLSNSSCFPEVAGEAGEFFDPTSETDMASAMDHILSDKNRRDELIQLGNERVKLFTWEETARKTQEVYKHVLSSL